MIAPPRPAAVAVIAAPAEQLAALGQLLDDLATTLLGIDEETYRATPAAPVSGSIGQHVRHVLDHVAAFVAADPGATLDYDRRQRGTTVETDPAAALRQMFRLKAALERSAARPLEMPVLVSAQIERGGEPVVGWSSFGRELAFVVSHTIHHQALIAVLLTMLEESVPDRFGYAPSTPPPG
jgi:uncharacterized damage-inducible protein DinB